MLRSRLTWLAGLLFLAHLLVLTTLGKHGPGPFLSNLIELSFGFVAIAATYVCGRRSGPFGRRVWWFVTVAVSIWTVAQGVITYYENFLHASFDVRWPSDILIFFWVLPVFMALFMATSSGRKPIDVVQILDFAQIVILMLAAYIAYLYVPSQWEAAGRWMAKLGWDATNVRDAVLVGGLATRGLLARTELVRSLFRRLAAIFLCYQIADLIYHYVEEVHDVKTGSPWDLLWSLPFLVAVIAASTWQRSDESELTGTSVGQRATKQVLFVSSAFLPLPVLFVAFEVHKETLLFGAGLVVASLLLSASRLLITQMRRDRSEEALRHRENEFNEAQRLAQIGSWEWDVDADAVDWSEELYRIARRDPSLPPPRFSEFSSIYPADTMDRLRPLVEEAVRDGTPYSLEMERKLPNGTKKSFIARGEPVRDGSGRVVRLRGTVQDITDRKQSEVALQESEERFRGLSDASFEGVAFSDAGKVVLANSRLAEMLGCTMEELIGSNVAGWIAPESREMVMNHISNGWEGTYENYLQRKDGTIFPVETRARQLPWKGKIVRVTAIRDVTERKRSEQMLRLLTKGTGAVIGSEFFSSLVQHCSTALGARYAFVSERLEEGRARMLANWADGALAANVEYDLDGTPCREVLKGETCIHRENVQLLFPQDKGLARMGVESYLGVPLRESTGRVIGHLAVLDTKPMPEDHQAMAILEIFAARAGAELERKHALEAVEREKAFSEAVIDSLPGFVFVINPKGEVIRWNRNAEAILGYPREELVEFNTIDVIAPEDHEIVAEKWLQAFDIGQTTCEARVQTKDGRKIPFLLSAVRTGIGESIYVIGTGIDISDRKQAEEALQAEKVFSDALIDSIPGIFYVIDNDGRLVRWNKRTPVGLGYSNEELAGMEITSLIPEEERSHIAATRTEVREKGSVTLETQIQKRDGQKVPFIFTGVRTIIGERQYTVGTGIDISERKRAEEALVSEKAFTEAVIDSLPGVLFVQEPGGRLIQWNRNLEEIGYSSEELASMSVDALTAPEDRARAHAAQQKVFAEGSATVELEGLAKDGTRIPFFLSAVRAEIDSKPYLVCTGVDITERRRAEEALRESEHRYRQLVEHANDIIYETDRNGRFTFVNPVATRILGYSQHGLIGRSYLDLVRPDFRAEVESFYKRQRVNRISSTYLQFPVVAKDGTDVWLGQHVQLAAEGNRVLGFRAIARDRTKQKLAEDALVESEERFRQMAENSPDVFFLWDILNQTVLYVSPGFEEIWGHNVRELYSNPRLWRDTVHPGDRERILTDFDARAITVGTQDEFRIIRPDKSVRWLHGRTFPIKDQTGRTRRLGGLVYDITERKKAEQALVKLKKAVDTSGEVIFMTDREGVFTSINPEFTRLYGYNEQEVVGKVTPRILKSGKVNAAQYESLWKGILEKRTFQGEIINKTKDGRLVDIETSLSAILGDQGEIVGFLAIQRDISYRKRAEEALALSEDRYRMLIESAPEAIVVADYDSGKFVDFNENATHFFGFPKEELLQIGPLEVSPPTQPDGRPSAEASFDHMSKAMAGEIPVFEWVHRNAAGIDIPCEVRLIRFPTAGGRHVRASITDITARKQAEEALAFSEARYRTLIESAPEAIVVLDAETGKFVDFNDNATSLFGLSGDELLKRTPIEISPVTQPDGRPSTKAAREYISRAAAGYVPVFEWMHRNSQGVDIPCEVRLVRLPGSGRALLRGSVTDITARKQAEAALRASDERYRDFISHSQEGVWRIEIDPPIPTDIPFKEQVDLLLKRGYLAECNDAMGRLMGASSAGDIIGKKLTEFLRFDDSRLETFVSAASGGWQNRTFQFQAPDIEGRQKHMQRTEVPIIEGGLLKRVWGTTRDVTDLHHAEEALRASEQRHRLLFERSVAGVLETTLDGRVLECNDAFARIQGYVSRDEFLSANIKDFYLERADGTALIDLLKHQPIVMGQEFQTRRKDGLPIWMLVSASLVEEERGQSSILATAFDITQWKELGEQLRQSQKMEAVGRLAGGVAHDFNNMLQIINGYSELVIDQLPPEDPLRSHVHEIKSIVERAAGLTRQLLAFSRQQVLAPQVLDLNVAVSNLSKMLRRLIGEDVELKLIEGKPLSRVKADPGQIDQVILNLAVNARDAMPLGGKLSIRTANVDVDADYARAHFPMTTGSYVKISVTDTGHGMSPETQARIFEPFFTTKETGKGTGLGLATVYGIIKQSGGYIWVESEVNKGTTFNVFLPPAKEDSASEQSKAGPSEMHGTETILLVEDEEYVRSLVRRSLQSKGYRVLEARNGQEALRVSQQHEGPIDLLITDVVMPGMSGRELSENLSPMRPRIKTLFISGYTDDSILRRGVLKSGAALLQKPFTAEVLASKVRQVLGG